MTRAATALPFEIIIEKMPNYFATASLRALPALNCGTLVAGILMGSFVLGLCPVRAARFFASKIPKPTSWTLSPFAIAQVMASMVAARAFSLSFFVRPYFSAIALISSFLFIRNDPPDKYVLFLGIVTLIY
jgi:hypothetical protein